MSLRTIITSEDPRLRERARKVRTITPALQTLVDDMVETMRAAPGVGLAATQLAVGQRSSPSSIATTSRTRDAGVFAVVNRYHHRPREGTERGCRDSGTPETWNGTPGDGRGPTTPPCSQYTWLARIFQHEIDHLDGVLFIDRATRVWKIEPEEETSDQLPVASSQ
jgi:peptide deformylase